jgi:hypothetical protein
MQRVIRIGTVADQDRFRRADIGRMSPSRRVRLVLGMQQQFLDWDRHPMQRVATVRRLGDPSHAA